MDDKFKKRVEMIFRHLETDVSLGRLSDSQANLVESFKDYWDRNDRLSERQTEILEDIYRQAALKD